MSEPLDPSHEALIREALLWENKWADGMLSDAYSSDHMRGMTHAFTRAFDHLGITTEQIVEVSMAMLHSEMGTNRE